MEIEAKYLISQGVAEQLKSLRALAGFKRESMESRDIIDTYYDTANRRLGNSGGGYRVRVAKGKRRATFKQREGYSGNTHMMREVESDISKGEFLTLHSRAKNLGAIKAARIFFKNEPIEEVLTINNARLDLNFSHQDATKFVMSIDDIEYFGNLGRFREREVECEYKRGCQKTFQEFIHALEEKYSLHPTSLGKYERAIKIVDKR